MLNLKIKQITCQWHNQISKVMDTEVLDINEISQLLKETHETVMFYKSELMVPKNIVQLLLCIEQFLYFSSIMKEENDNEDFFYPIFFFIEALKNGFFEDKPKYMFEPSDTVRNLIYGLEVEEENIREFITTFSSILRDFEGIKLLPYKDYEPYQ